jgi:transcriptional regulator with XRE-family HTH domain
MVGMKTKPENPWPARLKKRRKELGLTQKEAAERFCVSFATWRGWELGRLPPGTYAKKFLEKVFFS